MRNGTLNVVPLTSRKINKKYDYYTVNLGNELYNKLQVKLKKEKEKIYSRQSELNIIEKEKVYIEKMEKEISKMKEDSIALINQITTISKQRIYTDLLTRNVKLSNKALDLIDEKIIKYFTK